ncbi:MAG: hypothetical protein P4L16_00505 [Chlamydiales bacterium]|nr:hypothetical protein [Chlamydiales bacterium]
MKVQPYLLHYNKFRIFTGLNVFFIFLVFCPIPIKAIEGNLQTRVGYFHFTNHTVQKIYGYGASDIELEGSIKIHPNVSLWSNISYIWKNGHSTALVNNTHLDIGTLSMGMNLLTPLRYFSSFLYFGLGISGAYIHTRDETTYLPTNTSKFSIGGVAKFGIFIPLPCNKQFFLNPFFDYYYQPVDTKSSSTYSQVDVGGFRVGLGGGYNF